MSNPSLSALAAVLLVLCVVAIGTSRAEVKTKWQLPLGLGANENTGTLAIANDDTTLYTADTRGTIFAVEAKTGRLKWSIPGNAALDQLFVFPSVPDLVYYSSWDMAVVGQLSLRAVRKVDGVEVARLGNLSTGSVFLEAYAKVIPTKYGLAILHDYGVYSTDSHLNVQWKVDAVHPGQFSGQYFTHLAASDSLIATVARTSVEVEGRAVSFDAKTGAVVCNISNVTSGLLSDFNYPFILTEDGWSYLDYTLGSADAAFLLPRAVNLKTCGVYRTERINVVALWGGSDLAIIPRTNGSEAADLFFGFSRELINGSLRGNWTITHSKIGSNDTIWNLTLPANAVNPLVVGGLGQPPLITEAQGVPDAVMLWYLGTFSAIDVTTGNIRWTLDPTTVPTSPPLSVMDPQTVFPLGDGGRLFVPNLLGYTVVDTYSGMVLDVNFAEPILATLPFTDSDSGAYVVFVTVFGTAVSIW